MRKILLILALIVILILLIGQGCQKKEAVITPPKETVTDKTVNEIGGSISDIDNIDNELNISDLDNIEKELDEINW